MKKIRRKKLFYANKLHRKLMLVIFVAVLAPAMIVGICFYYLILNVATSQIGGPGTGLETLMPLARQVNLIVLFTLPLSIIFIWLWALIITRGVVGPFDRLIRELDDRIRGIKTGHIHLRRKDAMVELTQKINILLDKREEGGRHG